MDKLLLDQSARELLSAFGAGNATPGAGSGAALGGLISANLLLSVCKMTIEKGINPVLNWHAIEARLIECRQNLEQLFQIDSDVFEKVVELRRRRNQADDSTRDRIRRDALEQQKESTELPLRIGHACMQIADYALDLFDHGFSAARGDSCVGATFAISAAESCVALVNLNLKDYFPSHWREGVGHHSSQLMAQVQVLRPQIADRVEQLRSLWPVQPEIAEPTEDHVVAVQDPSQLVLPGF